VLSPVTQSPSKIVVPAAFSIPSAAIESTYRPVSKVANSAGSVHWATEPSPKSAGAKAGTIVWLPSDVPRTSWSAAASGCEIGWSNSTVIVLTLFQATFEASASWADPSGSSQPTAAPWTLANGERAR